MIPKIFLMIYGSDDDDKCDIFPCHLISHHDHHRGRHNSQP
jgi:hypothetical protein